MGSTTSKCKNLKSSNLTSLRTGLNSSEIFIKNPTPVTRNKLIKICQPNERSLSTIYEAPLDLEESNIP